MIRSSSLKEYVREYRARSELPLSDGYVAQLENAVSLLDFCIGHPVRCGELSDALVNRYVDWLASQGRRPATVRGRRNAILALWRSLVADGAKIQPPGRVRRVRVGRTIPVAWTAREVVQLVHTVLADESILPHGIPRGIWLGSLIAAGWDTALRLGDLLALEQSALASMPIRVRQHKTGDDIIAWLAPETLALVRQVVEAGPPRRLIWPLWGRREAFYRHMGRLVRQAGVRPGTFRWLRRGAITSVELLGGNGSALAGHRSRLVTERHYLDAAQLAERQVRPQSLWVEASR